MNDNEVISLRLSKTERQAIKDYIEENTPAVKDRTHVIKIALSKLLGLNKK